MLKVEFNQAGKPEKVLQLMEVEMPVPLAGQVRVRVKASNINPSDLLFIEGLYGLKPKLPNSGAGSEATGIIDAVGEGVDIPLNTRVMFTTLGAWAEYVIISAKTAVIVPDAISDEIACQSFVNPFTAWAMLHDSGLQAGDWLLLTAGGSTFGQLVIQMAKAKGIHTIATVRRPDQDEQLKNLGVSEIINTETEDLLTRVHEITEGKGIEVCFEAVGGKIGGLALQTLKTGGKMLIYGLLSLENSYFDNSSMIFKNLSVKGFWLTSWLAQVSNEVRKQMKDEVFTLLSGQLTFKIDGRYALKDVQKAVIHAQNPGRKGKILIVNE
jgi:NADPH:quinone reductase-like Zn-dependent oxidoreductase